MGYPLLRLIEVLYFAEIQVAISASSRTEPPGLTLHTVLHVIAKAVLLSTPLGLQQGRVLRMLLGAASLHVVSGGLLLLLGLGQRFCIAATFAKDNFIFF